MMNKVWHGLAATGLGATLLLGSMGFSVPAAVDKDDVASSVTSKLREQGVQLEQTTCPDDLVAEVGRVLRCEFTTGGQPVDAVVTVASVAGTTVNYDIRTEPRPVARALLDQKVAELIGQQVGVPIDSSSCEGDLAPQVDGSVNCTLTGPVRPPSSPSPSLRSRAASSTSRSRRSEARLTMRRHGP